MSVVHGISHIELWFALGALVLTVAAGLVLWPGIRNALSEAPDAASISEDPKGPAGDGG